MLSPLAMLRTGSAKHVAHFVILRFDEGSSFHNPVAAANAHGAWLVFQSAEKGAWPSPGALREGSSFSDFGRGAKAVEYSQTRRLCR